MRKIPPFKLVAVPLDEEARALPPFRWAGGTAGQRHRLGGEPDGPVAPEQWPSCPSCREQMSFYGQLDGINDDIAVADLAVICVYLCFDCFEAKAVVQPTLVG